MSINNCSSETTRVWWSEQSATWLNNSHTHRFNLNNTQDEEEEDDVVEENVPEGSCSEEEEKEAMFEKALTPSDVGKLNRLVIPKQHAEKYFPLDSSGDTSKGLLLSFEDESGKSWRFRYSYWNSSQSYVLTKGWSRYVKDKRLHPGDVVLFHKHRIHPHRFFITSTRRIHPTPPVHVSSTTSPPFYSALPYPTHHLPFPYPPHSLHAGGGSQGQNETGNSSSSSSSCRVLRLFGVNMECQPDNDSETSTPECSYNIMSSTQGTLTQHLYHHPHQPSYSSPNPHHHMVRQQPY